MKGILTTRMGPLRIKPSTGDVHPRVRGRFTYGVPDAGERLQVSCSCERCPSWRRNGARWSQEDASSVWYGGCAVNNHQSLRACFHDHGIMPGPCSGTNAGC